MQKTDTWEIGAGSANEVTKNENGSRKREIDRNRYKSHHESSSLRIQPPNQPEMSPACSQSFQIFQTLRIS
jgi:hypothetical protein